MEFLDNLDILRQRDPESALGVIAGAAKQATWQANIEQITEDDFIPSRIVLAGMGGSCLGGLMAKSWLDYQYHLAVPFEVVRDYVLPNYVNNETLVICFSVSGNTEETLSSLDDAQAKGARIVVIASGGKLLEVVQERHLPFVRLGKISQPRYGVIMHLRAITKILAHFGLVLEAYDEIAKLADAVKDFTAQLLPEVAGDQNPAKQLAAQCTDRTPIIYASSLFAPLAYKWKISFNENAKNTAWWNELPEFSHNEFIGWASHPTEKPFAIIDLRSNFDHPRIALRFDLTRKLLSAHRPEPFEIQLHGESVLCQMLCGAVLADFTSIYLGILNDVDPTPVALVEELKKELVS